MFLLLSLLLAALLGYIAHRAGLCSVKAVTELLIEHRCSMLVSFLKAGLWATLVSLLLLQVWPQQAMPMSLYPLHLPALLGGLLFGMGAAVNGGCAVSTLSRLVSGELAMLATLTGFCLAAALPPLIALPAPLPTATLLPAPLLIVALTLWAGWELWRLWHAQRETTAYRLTIAALLLGLSSGVLYALYGAWTYTGVLRHTTDYLLGNGAGPQVLMLGLALALVAGMALSVRQRRCWQPGWEQGGRHFAGGLLMGIGATLIPGGNDELLLCAIPGLSPHALPAFAALLVGVAFVLLLSGGLNQNMPTAGRSAIEPTEHKP